MQVAGDVAETERVEQYRCLLGAGAVLTEAREISRYLRDFSWYSPILENALADTSVEAVLRPATLDELRAIIAVAARDRTPITIRGAGTGNYGQSLPLERGIVVDIKGIAGVLEVSPGQVAMLPGTLMKHAEEAANETGQELAVMPSTYRVATAAGFICGGSGGIGASAFGDLWNGNVLAVEIMTVEEQPRTIRLEADAARPILHTYGTIGVVTRVEMRLVPAHRYVASIVVFSDFEQCCRFGWELIPSDVHVRLVSLQEAPIGSMMTPIAQAVGAADHLALVWSDVDHDANLAALIAEHGGRRVEWPAQAVHITQFPYSHTILWSRKAIPDSSWLQCEYAADDEDRFVEQVRAVSDRYPGVFLQHIEINVSRTGGVRCMGIPPIVGLENHDTALDELFAYCRSIGISLLNPHSYVVEEGGFVGDVDQLLELKQVADPYGILNPGKLGQSFFAGRNAT